MHAEVRYGEICTHPIELHLAVEPPKKPQRKRRCLAIRGDAAAKTVARCAHPCTDVARQVEARTVGARDKPLSSELRTPIVATSKLAPPNSNLAGGLGMLRVRCLGGGRCVYPRQDWSQLVIQQSQRAAGERLTDASRMLNGSGSHRV